MTKPDVLERRVRAQGIGRPTASRPEAAVRRMGALQAQDQAQANWAVGLRTASADLKTVEQALREAKLVLTWPNRGTLHYVHADDVRWLLGLLAPRNLARARRRMAQLELDHPLLSKAEKIIERALRGEGRLSRSALLRRLADNGVDPSGQRGYHIIWYLGQKRFLCFGPREGKSQTFVLFEEWVPPSKEVEREEALRELALRYFSSHGPATRKDFAKWAGVTDRDARIGIEGGTPEIRRMKLEERELLYTVQAGAPEAFNFREGHLLPAFDEYLLGYKDRADVLDAAHADRVAPGGNGMFRPMMELEGQIVGTWRKRAYRDHLQIELEPFEGYHIGVEEFSRAVERYSHFTGAPCEILRR